MNNRKCIECGASLTDEDVMKIKVEDDPWETIPIPLCPPCFTNNIRKLAYPSREAPNGE